MVKTVAISQLKTHCLRLVDDVARRHRELVITKRGKPIARLVPIGDAPMEAALSGLRGTLIAGGTRISSRMRSSRRRTERSTAALVVRLGATPTAHRRHV